jgi:glutathione S-transferase
MVFILLEELQLRYITTDVKSTDIDTISKLNPLNKIPIVHYGNKTLTEPRSILRYISRNNIDVMDLWLNSDVNVDIWMEVEGRELNPYLTKILEEPQSKSEQSLKEVEKVLDIYEARLKEHDFLCGDLYSIADITNIPFLYAFIKGGYKDIVKKRPAVYAWVKRIMKRDAVQSVLQNKN